MVRVELESRRDYRGRNPAGGPADSVRSWLGHREGKVTNEKGQFRVLDSRTLLNLHCAWVAELADAPDLKSGAPQGAYGFDPRPGH
jgi:hypothetical protein